MGMSKEEFMARYKDDLAKKELQKERELRSYFSERSNRIFKKQLRDKRLKRICM